VVANECTGFAECDDLGVCGRVGRRDVAVPSPSHDLSVADHNGAHGDLSSLQSALGAAQGFFHPELVRMKFVRMKFVRVKVVRVKFVGVNFVGWKLPRGCVGC
jgi:hypothetical protein